MVHYLDLKNLRLKFNKVFPKLTIREKINTKKCGQIMEKFLPNIFLLKILEKIVNMKTNNYRDQIELNKK